MIAILADAFVRATVLLVLAAVVTVFLRRSPASLRHLVWTLACGGVLALPLASALLPNWRLTPDWTTLVVPVWLSGVGAVLILLAVGMARIMWLDRVTRPVEDEACSFWSTSCHWSWASPATSGCCRRRAPRCR